MSLPGPGAVLKPFATVGMKVWALEPMEKKYGIPAETQGEVAEYRVDPEDVIEPHPDHAVAQLPTLLVVRFEGYPDVKFTGSEHIGMISSMGKFARENVLHSP